MSQCEPRQRAENALESDCRFSRQIETAGRRRVAGECHDESSTCSNTDAPRSGSTASGREQSESPDSTLNRKEQIHGAPIWLSSATCRIFWNRLPIWRWGALCARMDGGSLFLQCVCLELRPSPSSLRPVRPSIGPRRRFICPRSNRIVPFKRMQSMWRTARHQLIRSLSEGAERFNRFVDRTHNGRQGLCHSSGHRAPLWSARGWHWASQ